MRNNFTCELSDGRRLIASLQATFPRYDIALLRVAANDLPVAEWNEIPPEVASIVASVGPDQYPLNIGAVGSTLIDVPPDKGQLGFKVRAGDGGVVGVVVNDILFARTNEVLKAGDVITQFDDQPVRSFNEFRRYQDQFFASDKSIVGATIPVQVERGELTIQVRIPVESASKRTEVGP